jgi:serine protease Do
MSKNARRRLTAGSFTIALGVLLGAGLHSGFLATSSIFAAPGEGVATEAFTTPAAMAVNVVDLSNAFADLAERTTPAVVQIEVTISNQAVAGIEPSQSIPEPFRRFFENPQVPDQGTPMRGGGSGFLVSADGYIVTNNHVVGEADEITVTLHDHRAYTAELVGTDPTTDVAVIKIDGSGLPYLNWGRSSTVRVGSWVMAIGSPGVGDGQLQSTVTTGIVSAKGRPLRLIGQGLANDPRYGREYAGYAIENFIQTDAVINPGNSGGPMVDPTGNVIGVNSAIASTDGHYQGYGFAIPSDLVHKVASDLIQHGSVRRPWLGVQVLGVTPEDAEAFHLPSVSGVVIQSVTAGGPAEDAGLEQGDVIVAVNGVTIGTGGALQEQIAILDQGDQVTVGVFRDGRARDVKVRLGAAPSPSTAPAPRSASSGPAASRGDMDVERLGLTFRSLDQATARELGFQHEGGVVVSDVDPMGPAASRGVGAGLRLKRFGQVEIGGLADIDRAMAGVSSGNVVTLVVESPAGDTRIVNIRAR